MKESERFDRKRRRPKPRNHKKRKSLLLRPWFLKCLMIYVAPAMAKVIEVAYEIVKRFWN